MTSERTGHRRSMRRPLKNDRRFPITYSAASSSTPMRKRGSYVSIGVELEAAEYVIGKRRSFFRGLRIERSALPDHVFGCFEFDANEETGIVRLHFYNRSS